MKTAVVDFQPMSPDSLWLSRDLVAEKRRKFIFAALGMCGAILIYLPKLLLVNTGEDTAGIRVEDLTIALIFWVVLVFPYRGARYFRPLLAALGAFVGLGLFSNLVNTFFYQRSSVLFSLRFAEYFVYAYLGYLYAQRYSLRRLALGVGGLNGVVMILQLFHIVGGFTTKYGYVSSTGYRPIGLTNGAYEVGALLNLCVAVLVADPGISRNRKYLYVLASIGLILISGARMPLLAALYLSIVVMVQGGVTVAKAVQSLAGVVLICGLVVLLPNRASERSAGTFKESNVTTFTDAYINANPVASGPLSFDAVNLTDETDTDLSWTLRAVKWSAAIKTLLVSPFAWLFGIGLGTDGVALDGGWVRVFTETGLVGLVVFCGLLWRLAKIAPALQYSVVCLAINMIMIDVHLSSKIMTCLFFLAGGYALLRQRSSSKARRRRSPYAGSPVFREPAASRV